MNPQIAHAFQEALQHPELKLSGDVFRAVVRMDRRRSARIFWASSASLVLAGFCSVFVALNIFDQLARSGLYSYLSLALSDTAVLAHLHGESLRSRLPIHCRFFPSLYLSD
jgi:hypothetical protein